MKIITFIKTILISLNYLLTKDKLQNENENIFYNLNAFKNLSRNTVQELSTYKLYTHL